MTRRIALLGAALLMALLGTALVLSYANGRTAPAEASEDVVSVLAAKELVPAGTTGRKALEDGLIALVEMPKRLVPEGAMVDIADVQDQETATDLRPGEVLLPSRFLATALAGTMDIPGDKVAISLQLADPQRVAGFVRPGSDVAVFATYEVAQAPLPKSPGETQPVVEQATRLLLPRATVVAVGPTALRVFGTASATDEDATTTEESGALVTVAVSIEDAQRLAHVALTGQVTLGLLNQDSRTKPVPASDNRTLFG